MSDLPPFRPLIIAHLPFSCGLKGRPKPGTAYHLYQFSMRLLCFARNDGKAECHCAEQVSRNPERSEEDEAISKCHIAKENWYKVL